MPIQFTRKGRYRLSRDGIAISEHNDQNEAYENAFEHAETYGVGDDELSLYRVDPPWVEIAVPIVTVSRGPKSAPPPAPGFVAPNAPTGVSAAQGTPNTSVIRVSFTQGTDPQGATITANKLYGANASGGTFTLVATLGAGITFGEETGIAPSTQRFYKVTTVNQHGLESAFSSEVNATTAAGAPAAGEPQIYPLEIAYPKAVGAAGTGLSSTNRCYFAYPGIEYSIRACAIGGSYPYTWSLSNAPVGMSINSSTGAITMPSPVTGTYSNIQVTCTDSLGSVDSETWSIVVGTSGWNFLDAVSGNDTTGTGLIGAPWRTLAKLQSTAAADSRTYFRAGTYTLAGMPINNNAGTQQQRTNWNQVADSMCWIAYPGDAQPVIDYEYSGTLAGGAVSYFNVIGAAMHFEGLKFYRSNNHAIRFNVRTSNYGVYIRNCLFDTCGDGLSDHNSAPLMWSSSTGSPSYFDIVTDCTFNNLNVGPGPSDSICALKIYGVVKALVQDNDFTDTGPEAEGTVAVKGDVLHQITIRGNTFPVGNVTAIGGNMASNSGGYYGEICYNLMLGSTSALTLGRSKIQDLGQINVYRNTMIGNIVIENLVTGDGPYVFRHNVIINTEGAQTPWPYFTDGAISDATRVTLDGNLTGVAADGIVDASGNLQGTYLTNYGPTTANPRGYQI